MRFIVNFLQAMAGMGLVLFFVACFVQAMRRRRSKPTFNLPTCPACGCTLRNYSILTCPKCNADLRQSGFNASTQGWGGVVTILAALCVLTLMMLLSLLIACGLNA